MRGRDRKEQFKLIALIAALIICLSLTACGGGSQPGQDGGGSGSQEDRSGDQTDQESPDGGVDPGGQAEEASHYEVPEFRDAVFDPDAAEGNDEVQVDMSSVNSGYLALVCNSDKRIKLQVLKDEEKYVYDVIQGVPQIFPLQCGDGTYTFRVMKNIEENKYFELYSCSAEVTLADANDPYLRPNQYADYDRGSECVVKAGELAADASSEEDFVNSVFKFVTSGVSYDYEKAETVPSGYIPEPDETMSTGKGICIDYASLTASMLRSQGIPTKIIFGYVAPNDLYHAWNMFYTEKTGWTTVEFKVSPGDWHRIDLTFSANGSNASFIGNGSNYTDVYQY